MTRCDRRERPVEAAESGSLREERGAALYVLDPTGRPRAPGCRPPDQGQLLLLCGDHRTHRDPRVHRALVTVIDVLNTSNIGHSSCLIGATRGHAAHKHVRGTWRGHSCPGRLRSPQGQGMQSAVLRGHQCSPLRSGDTCPRCTCPSLYREAASWAAHATPQLRPRLTAASR